MEENARNIAEMLRVLANETRLMTLCLLIDGPLSVSEIAKRVPGITASALSQHLVLLKAHRILDKSRSKQNVIYFISDQRVVEILKVLKEHYCCCGEK